MHQVVARLAADRDLRRRGELDPLVVLDLRQRRTDDLLGGDRFGLRVAEVVPGQHEQVLAVAPHPRRQVVEFEQTTQGFRVLLVGLHPIQHRQLAFDEVLGALGEVDEHRVDVLAQERLFTGQPHRLPVHRVERARDLADLLAGEHRHGRDTAVRGHEVGVRIGEDLVHGGGQAVLGDVERGVAQDPQRSQQRTADDHGEHAAQQQSTEHHRGVHGRGAAGVRSQRVAPLLGLHLQRLLRLVGQVDRAGDRLLPLAGVEPRQVLPVLAPGHGEFEQRGRGLHGRAGHGLRVGPLLGRGGERAVVVLRGDELGIGTEESPQPVRGDGALGERLVQDGALDRHLVLDPGQRVGRQPQPGEVRVRDLRHRLVGQVEHAGDEVAVGRQD